MIMEVLSQLWSLLGLLTVLQNLLPSQLLSLLHSLHHSLQSSLTPFSYFDVPEFLGSSSVDPNPLYRHLTLYLHHSNLLLQHPSSSNNNNNNSPPPPRLTLSGTGPHHSFSLSPNHSVADTFLSHRLLWTLHSDTLNDSLEERRTFTLRLPKRHASSILPHYLSHISSSAEALDAASRDRRIHTNIPSRSSWSSIPFLHPATFQTLALDPDLKTFLISDLDSFAKSSEFYRNVGRPWKRGYLLYGPPGSGKSSLIAAIANHLHYDVFDLELTRVASNSELRSLLVQTTNRSVIVIEDIDCSLSLTGDRRNKKLPHVVDSDGEDHSCRGRVTLSGLLNFTDGLWSCCGEERIIVFTTNYKDRVDEALLRAGRMDVHVRLGTCGDHAMREMIERYLGDEVEEELMELVETCVRLGAGMTPAEIGEVLMRSRGSPAKAIRELVGELEGRVGVISEEDDQWEEVMSIANKRKRRSVKFLGRLKTTLTRSESGRRGV